MNVNIRSFKVEKGKRRKEVLRLEVFKLRDGSPLSIPCVYLSGDEDGSTVCIVAGHHGNEWMGVYIAHLIASQLEVEDVRGALVVIIAANPLAFSEGSRVSALDYIDLSRVYDSPFRRKPTEHLGQLLSEVVFSKVDLVIDLHSGGPGEYLPHLIIDDLKLLNEARYMGIRHVLVARSAKSSSFGAKVLTIEAGGCKKIDEDMGREIARGIRSYLVKIGVLRGELIEAEEIRVLKRKRLVPAPAPGLFSPLVKLGQEVSMGSKLGKLTKLMTRDELKIESPTRGAVLYLRGEPMVSEGETLVQIAL